MLRNSLLPKILGTFALLAASTGALAGGDHVYGRVVSVEPHFSISFGSGGYDGYRILYEVGGHHYWIHSQDRPGHMIWVPRPVAHHVCHHQHRHHHRHGWDDRHPGRWDDRQDGWREGRGDWRDHHYR